IFQVLKQAGRESFAAGIHLWHDLYGPWLAGWETVETLHHEDPRVLAAGIRALQDPRYQLVVVHFARADEAAHRFGPHTAAYAGAAAWYDQALGRLLEQVGPQTAVIVTADNGVSDRGGHAGPEPAVLTAPLVTFGPGLPQGQLGRFPQSRIPQLVLGALGLEKDKLPDGGEERGFDPWRLLPVLLALGGTLVLLGALANGLQAGWQGFILNSALWLGLGLALVVEPTLALWIFALALAGAAVITPLQSPGPLGLPLVVGGIWAGLWLYDGWQALGSVTATGFPLIGVLLLPLALVLLLGRGRPCWGRSLFWLLSAALLVSALALGGWPLAGVVALGLGLGLALGRKLEAGSAFDPRIAGLLLALCPTLLAGLLGETVSLSTLDVSRAFTVVDGPLGLPGAVAVTVLGLALPGLALAAGIAPALALATPKRAGALLAGLGAGLGGMGIVMALVLGLDWNHTATALGLGGLLRVVAVAVYLFPGLALGMGWAGYCCHADAYRTGGNAPTGTADPTDRLGI
ncbi:MAG: alkaline phosphatase family protein, partial [Candidatus Competibacteraceae bacterium]|nr:alkaline phosphatase family protein [Candidatus Competibacteraceae bacterium]